MSASRPFQDKPKIRVEALSLARGGRVLFEGLSFAAEPGAYVEIRGGNGAGKTTLLRTLAGYLKPRAGQIALEPAEEPALAIHFVGHQNGLKPTVSVASHLNYWAGLFGGAIDKSIAAKKLGLSALLERPARTLSQGQARRLSLSRLVLAPRPIWLLDEPAAALDTNGKAMLASIIDAHRADGGLVLAAVHEPLGPTPSHTLTVGV